MLFVYMFFASTLILGFSWLLRGLYTLVGWFVIRYAESRLFLPKRMVEVPRERFYAARRVYRLFAGNPIADLSYRVVCLCSDGLKASVNAFAHVAVVLARQSVSIRQRISHCIAV